MHGLNEIKAINAWASTKAAKKISTPVKKARVIKDRRLKVQGREIDWT